MCPAFGLDLVPPNFTYFGQIQLASETFSTNKTRPAGVGQYLNFVLVVVCTNLFSQIFSSANPNLFAGKERKIKQPQLIRKSYIVIRMNAWTSNLTGKFDCDLLWLIFFSLLFE